MSEELKYVVVHESDDFGIATTEREVFEGPDALNEALKAYDQAVAEGSKEVMLCIIQKLHKEDEEPVRMCRKCGCTDDFCVQCIRKTGSPCHWVEDDLCSACVE